MNFVRLRRMEGARLSVRRWFGVWSLLLASWLAGPTSGLAQDDPPQEATQQQDSLQEGEALAAPGPIPLEREPARLEQDTETLRRIDQKVAGGEIYAQTRGDLEGLLAEGGLALEGVEDDALEDVAQGHVEVLRQALEDLEDALLDTDSGLNPLDHQIGGRGTLGCSLGYHGVMVPW